MIHVTAECRLSRECRDEVQRMQNQERGDKEKLEFGSRTAGPAPACCESSDFRSKR